MTDAAAPLWEIEESVESKARAAFAFGYLTDIKNVEADPGIERVETDGRSRDRVGMRGTNYLTGGGAIDWLVSAVEPDRRFVIDVALAGATLRFEFRFAPTDSGCIMTQRVSLFGARASEYREEVQAAFGATLAPGMRAVRDRIDAASVAEGARE